MDCACKFCAPDEIQTKKPKINSATPVPAPIRDDKIQTPVPVFQPVASHAETFSTPNAPPTYPVSTHPSQVPNTQHPTTHRPDHVYPPPTQAQQPMWLSNDTAFFLKSQRPDLFDIYQHILRFKGENKDRGLLMITNELDRMVSLGYQIPGYLPRDGGLGPQTSQGPTISHPTSNMSGNMAMGGQPQPQQMMYGFGDQHNLNYNTPNYGYSHGVNISATMAGQSNENHPQLNLADDLINYSGEEHNIHGGPNRLNP
jgi:hypothetical protein